MEPARFAEVFDRHYQAILRYLRRRIGPDLADDLAAETFTLAFRRRHQYRGEHADAAAWLYGIAANLLRQHARAEVRRLRAYARVVPDPVGPDIGDGVAELDYVGIARALDVPEGTVRSRLHRARRRLRRQLGLTEVTGQPGLLAPTPPGRSDPA